MHPSRLRCVCLGLSNIVLRFHGITRVLYELGWPIWSLHSKPLSICSFWPLVGLFWLSYCSYQSCGIEPLPSFSLLLVLHPQLFLFATSRTVKHVVHKRSRGFDDGPGFAEKMTCVLVNKTSSGSFLEVLTAWCMWLLRLSPEAKHILLVSQTTALLWWPVAVNS